jgi:methionyl-tRNA formyltransferase
MTLRLAFMGTPEFAVPTLAEIVGAGHDVAAVYTRPPRPAGRGMAERPSAVHEFARAHGLKVRAPAGLRDPAARAAFAGLGLDAAVVVAYGLVLPADMLAAPAQGCLNLHASLLPRWRGAAPIARAVIAGDAETGVVVMRMDEGLDTGPVCLAERIAIGPDATAGELHDELARRGASLMVRALAGLERGGLSCRPQGEDGVTYAAKLAKAETRIDFDRPAREVHDRIRGLSPHPGAWCEAAGRGGPARIKVLRAELAAAGKDAAPGTVLDDRLTVACRGGAVRLILLQRAGRAPVPAPEFLRGTPLPAGAALA